MDCKDAKDIKLDPNVESIAHDAIGAAIEVHRHLGAGHPESMYERALAIEFQLRGVGFERQKGLTVTYKGVPLKAARLDFLVETLLVVEIKSIEQFAPIHTAQTMSYLKAIGLELALLLNFNVPMMRLGIKRVIRSKSWRPTPRPSNGRLQHECLHGP